jgi:toxin ParE1/3/4
LTKVVFYDQAGEEMTAAVAFYESRLAGLGLDLLDEVQHVVDRIHANPEIGGHYGRYDVRYLLCRRFPYTVYYLARSEFIWIVAIAHNSRGPGFWHERVADT